MSELERWLPVLQPPAGGMQRLQRAMMKQHREPMQSLRWPALASAMTASVVLAAMLWIVPAQTPSPDRVATALDEVASHPARRVRVVEGDAIEVRQAEAGVRVFLVMSR
jgi:hypothetical protein